MKTKLVFFLILLLALSAGGYRYFSKKKGLPYNLASVARMDIVQKVSADGRVSPAEKINLAFESQGRIKKIEVEAGDKVKKGDLLASLEREQLVARVSEAEAAEKAAEASLERVLAGAGKEEVKTYKTAVENKKIALEKARNNLNRDYGSALDTLESAYLKLYNAFNFIDSLQRDYFFYKDQEGIRVSESKEYKIKKPMEKAKGYLDAAKKNPFAENLDTALLEMKDALERASEGLSVIRDICQDPLYRNRVSSADKTSLDNERDYINTALTSIDTARKGIALDKDSLRIAEGNLRSSQDKLSQITAPPQKADVDLYRARLNQAKASLLVARQELAKALLTSPSDGTITNVMKKEGEVAAPAEPVISMIDAKNLQIDVEIPEADIGKVALGNPAEISLDAFPDEEFSGKVVKIDPAETIVQGVVYYKVTVEFKKIDERIKPGMTASVDIISQSKKNVITIPQRAVLIKKGRKIVRVLKRGKIKEVEVRTGIRDNQGDVEILSGLGEGEKVITFLKEK